MSAEKTLLVARSLPGLRNSQAGYQEPRDADGYGDQGVMVFDPRMAAHEGSYSILRNPTPGTGVAGHAAPTTLDQTKPFIMIKNGNEVGGKRIYLDFIKLLVTAAGTGGTLNYASHILDQGSKTSGGAAMTEVNPNSGGVGTLGTSFAFAGDIVAVAGSEVRIVAHQRVRTVIPVAGDEILFNFGGPIQPSGMALEGTTEVQRVIHCPPVIIEPGWIYKLVLWRASQSAAASYEIEVGAYAR